MAAYWVLKHPKRVDCMNWAYDAWQSIRPEVIIKTAPKVFMTPDPGPEIPGYSENRDEQLSIPVEEDGSNLIEADIGSDQEEQQ